MSLTNPALGTAYSTIFAGSLKINCSPNWQKSLFNGENILDLDNREPIVGLIIKMVNRYLAKEVVI